MSVDYPRRGGGLARPSSSGDSLADILERVLDKGIVIAGDIQINLLDIELLTIKLRLIVASIDKAKEMGIDWWETDPALNAVRCEGAVVTAASSRSRWLPAQNSVGPMSSVTSRSGTSMV